LNAYIDQHRDAYGVEPICQVLQIAPSAYRRHAAAGAIRICAVRVPSAMRR
jgi:putative transposase